MGVRVLPAGTGYYPGSVSEFTSAWLQRLAGPAAGTAGKILLKI